MMSQYIFFFKFLFSPPQQQKSLEHFSNRYYFQATAIRAVTLGDGRLGSALDILHRYYFLHIKKKNLIKIFVERKTVKNKYI